MLISAYKVSKIDDNKIVYNSSILFMLIQYFIFALLVPVNNYICIRTHIFTVLHAKMH